LKEFENEYALYSDHHADNQQASLMSEINIGSNLDYHWLCHRSFHTVVEPLMEEGLTVLEVHLDLRVAEIADHIEFLCESAAAEGLGVNFHAPFLEPPLMYGFSGEEQEIIISHWTPVLDIVNRYANTNGIRSEMVLHGSHGPDADMKVLLADTIGISRWILEYCPNIFLGIENLPTPRNPNELVKFGENRESVLEAVKLVAHPRCGITWDMGHCVRNKVFDLPTDEWIQRVVHVHLHDVDKDRQDHWPLILGSTPYRTWISALKAQGFAGTITAELNSKLYNGWTQEEIDQNLLKTIEKIRIALEQ
jgi:hypothetical protein